jgi:hypothetical protein
MRKSTALKFLAILAVGTTMMYGQATRTWVSGVGDDANPCSRTAPCKTFAGAISKTAPGGEIDALDPGGFGALTITKSITLDGGGGQVASILVAGTNGIVVAAQPTDVVIIRNLRFDGLLGAGNTNAGLSGIRWIGGRVLGIENVTVTGFNNNGIDIANSVANAVAWIQNTTVENCNGHGVSVVSTATTQVHIDGSHFEFVNFGVLAGSNSKVTVTNSVSTGNGQGFAAEPASGTAELDIQNSSATNNNNNGVIAATNGTVRLTGNSIFGNAGSGTSASGGTIFTYQNNAIVGASGLTPASPLLQ